MSLICLRGIDIENLRFVNDLPFPFFQQMLT